MSATALQHDDVVAVTRRELVWLVAIVLGAFALRAAHVLAMRASPDFAAPQMDAQYHVAWARALARGEDFQPGPFFRAPLYPWFLAGMFRVFGDGLLAPRLVQAGLGALGVTLVWAIGRRVFSPAAGLLGAALLALHWVSVFFDGELLLESLAVPLYLAALLASLRALDSDRARVAFVAGALWGVGAITRPNVLAFLPIVAFVLLWSAPRRPHVVRAVACLAGAALVIAPISAYNAFVGKDRVLIASQGGVNLWIGNNPQSDGTSAIVPGTREDWWGGYRDAIALAERAEGRELAPSEVSRHYTSKALDFALSKPAAWLRLLAWKARWLAMDHELGNNEEPRFLARRYSPAGAWTELGWGALTGLAVAGWCGARRAWARGRIVWLYGLTYAATVLAFFVNARFRLPLVPVLALAAGAGLVAVANALREKRFARAAVLAALALAVAWSSRALVPASARAMSDANGRLQLAQALARNGDWAAARDGYERSLELWERSGIAWRGLGEAQAELGDLAGAETSYRRALELRADDTFAFQALFQLYQRAGRLDDAERTALAFTRVRPDLALGWQRVGRARFAVRDWSGAAQAFERGLAAAPRDFDCAYSLARARLELGDADRALDAFVLASKARDVREPEFHRDAVARALTMLRERGETQRAQELAREVRARDDAALDALLDRLGFRPEQ